MSISLPTRCCVVLLLVALVSMPDSRHTAALAQTEPPPCGYCVDVTFNKLKKCDVKVLKKSSGCPFDWIIKAAVCSALKKNEGKPLKKECNESCSCEDKKDIDGEVTRTYVSNISTNSCDATIKVTITVEAKGWEGTCKK
jgi:hypothetical protein